VAEGAISVNNDKVSLEKQSLGSADFHDGICVLRRGKNSLAIAKKA
jgi:hypothetical protein